MIIVSNKILWILCLFLGGSKANAIAFYPFIICRDDIEITAELINHESIHLKQQLELLIIPFYIWYLIEYYSKGYMNVSFEKEAYTNDNNLKYLKDRPFFGFLKYIKK